MINGLTLYSKFEKESGFSFEMGSLEGIQYTDNGKGTGGVYRAK